MDNERRQTDEVAPHSRIFVGNLDPSIFEEDLRSTFKRYGRISEIVTRKNFAFIQFDTPEEAQNAISKENGQNLKSRKMSISLAKARTFRNDKKDDGPFHGQNKRPRRQDHSRRRQNSEDEHPSRWEGRSGGRGGGRDQRTDSEPHFYDRHSQHHVHNENDQNAHYSEQMGDHHRGRIAPFEDYSRSQEPGPSYRHSENNYGEGPSGSGMRPFDDPPPRRDSYNSSLNQHNRRMNDVEIVCSNKSITVYAESIENRLLNFGLTVDILYPNPDFPLSKILGNITNRGVKYALLLTPMNMENRSVTLNVLQGVQQEHRNMPLEDALYFLSSNETASSSSSNRGMGHFEERNMSRHRPHPREILDILELLIQNKPLVLNDYDNLIDYLVKCREETLRNEYGNHHNNHHHNDAVHSGPSSSSGHGSRNLPGNYDKILGILHNKNDSSSSSSRFNDRELDQSESTSINPSLQKAIDSLIKTGPNLLNQIKKFEVPQRENTDSNVNNVLNNYYSSLFKNDGKEGRPSGSSSNNLFSAYGGN